MVPSDVLDTAKFENIYSRLTLAHSQAKTLAEDNLPEPMRSGIREREYELDLANTYQQSGNINAVLEDAGLQETLNMAK